MLYLSCGHSCDVLHCQSLSVTAAKIDEHDVVVFVPSLSLLLLLLLLYRCCYCCYQISTLAVVAIVVSSDANSRVCLLVSLAVAVETLLLVATMQILTNQWMMDYNRCCLIFYQFLFLGQ